MRLSLIVPVFDVQDYLRQCLDSLICQDLPDDDYEIVLIDDGSRDASGVICDEYAEKQPNIRVFHQENQGLSAARNVGVQKARGEFVQFVDSDDYIAPDVFGRLLAQIDRERLDMLRFNYENVNEAGEIIHPNREPKLFADYSDGVTDGADFLMNRLGFACYACQFIIRRQILLEDLFMEGIHFEDTEWVSRALPKVGRVASTEEVVYFYRIRQGSITKGMDSNAIRRNLEDQLKVVSLLQQRKQGIPAPSWYDGMISIMVISILSQTATKLYDERKRIVREVKAAKVIPLSTFYQNKPARRKIHIINLSPSLYCFLLHKRV